VSGGVEALPLLPESRRVELRVEDPFLAVERPGEVRAVGSEDRAAAAAKHVLALEQRREREVGGVGRGALEVARRDHEGT